MPSGRNKVFFVIIVVWRNSIKCVRQTQPGSRPVQNLTIPGIRAAEGMVRGRIPIQANAGVVARIVVPLIEQITTRIQTVADA